MAAANTTDEAAINRADTRTRACITSRSQIYRPNVFEHHARALYVNLPITMEAATKLTMPSITPAEYNGKAWISVVIDDLDGLWSIIPGGRRMPTGMSGWMTKVNLLVKGNVASSEDNAQRIDVQGYQILSIFFEKSFGGRIKVAGARQTQRIPADVATYAMSSGRTGSAMGSTMSAGATYSAVMTSKKGQELIKITGQLAPLATDEQREFARFVVERPHKFLVQESGAAAYSPETGLGTSFSADGIMQVSDVNLDLMPLLRSVLGADADSAGEAVCFLQPDYSLMDHHNVYLEARY